MEREKTPDSKSVQTFIPATVGLSPGLEADIRERLVQAFGADDEKSPVNNPRLKAEAWKSLYALNAYTRTAGDGICQDKYRDCRQKFHQDETSILLSQFEGCQAQ